MTGRAVLAGAALLAIAGLGSFGVAWHDGDPPGARPAAQRPELALVTSLPLVFGEEFSIDSGGSPALMRLEQRYRVTPIAVADAASLNGQRLLLMAHPRAQPAEALIELDAWVRSGGRLLLLADPQLDWPSERSLGDLLRPPPMFADTGLLKHWGLRLANGALASDGPCEVVKEGLVARCPIGSGEATIVADADFLNVEGPGADSLDLLMIELDRLETR